MNLLVSTYVNNIDKKGRISLPAVFRNVLVNEGLSGVMVYPSIKHNCIECCNVDRFSEIHKIIEGLDPYSEERDAFETVILGEAVQLLIDGEGRVILPKHLCEYAKIDTQASFVGKGSIVEIWNPDLFETHKILSKQIAQQSRGLLKNIKT